MSAACRFAASETFLFEKINGLLSECVCASVEREREREREREIMLFIAKPKGRSKMISNASVFVCENAWVN